MDPFAEVCARCMRNRMNSLSDEFYPTNHIIDNIVYDDDSDDATTINDVEKQLAK
ncbi:unnamed protein product, partial [Acanthocheilonema viteae]